VFAEAEEMARRYREQMPETHPSDEAGSSRDDDDDGGVPFEDEAGSYANWKWLKFLKSDSVDCKPAGTAEPGS
jgi:small subunit ribosomal protein S1